jgi:hypothetical protein
MRGNSPDISNAFFELVIWKFESSQVSQALQRSGNWPLTIAEKAAGGGLLQFSGWSLDSQFGGIRSEIVESLRPFFEIFPFSGDGSRRPGSIYTARPSLQWRSPKFSIPGRQKWGMPSPHFLAELATQPALNRLKAKQCGRYASLTGRAGGATGYHRLSRTATS